MWLGSVRSAGWGHTAHKSRARVVRLSTRRLLTYCLPVHKLEFIHESIRSASQFQSGESIWQRGDAQSAMCDSRLGGFRMGRCARNGYFVPLKRGWRPV